METLLDGWIAQRPCPISRSLESLWQRGDARERIASVAAIELRNWDGSAAGAVSEGIRPSGSVRIQCWVRRFPKPQFEVSFTASFGGQSGDTTATVLSAPQKPTLDLMPIPGGRVQPLASSTFTADLLIEGILRLANPAGVTVSRYPRRVIPLRRDELLNTFVECERLQLGEDSLLLIKNASELPQKALGLLGQIARPGFRMETSIPGLPAGWTLFTGVQIVGNPASIPSDDLNVLVPLLSSQLTIDGGSKLPGRIRKWSSLDPPEVRAVAHGAKEIRVVISALDEGNPTPNLPHTWSSTESALVADLSALDLADGDYELSLRKGDKPVQQALLRLRSSSSPDHASSSHATALAHDLVSDALGAFRAGPLSEIADARAVRGPFVPGTFPAGKTVPAPVEVWWNGRKPPQARPLPPVSLTTADPTSCAVTGAHKIQLPPADGTKRGPVMTGECTVCGFVKRYPTYIRWRKPDGRNQGPKVAPLHVDVSKLPEIGSSYAGWDVALDSLVHTGGGGYRTLEYVAGQIDESPLFIGTFARSLESRGDVQIRRGPDLAPTEWELSPPYIVELATGQFILIGRWRNDAITALDQLVEKAGGKSVTRRDPAGPPIDVVLGVTASELAQIAKDVGAAGLVPNAAERLAQALPPLSRLESGLPRVPMPGARRIERFHLESSSWTRMNFATEPGAYRLESKFAVTYLFRTAADIERGEAALATSHLSKHLAALHAGRPLLAYQPGQRILAVPVGADLPGLYGRAAVLCSGQLPVPDPKQRCLLYQEVPQSVADQLTRAMTN
jgi:hypothetical protein